MSYKLPATLLVLWIIGFSIFQVGGRWIHALLVMAAIALVWRLVTARRVVKGTP